MGDTGRIMTDSFEPIDKDAAREWFQDLASNADKVPHTSLACNGRGIKWAYIVRKPDLAYVFADGDEFRCMGEGADDIVRRLVNLFSSEDPRLTGAELVKLLCRSPAAIDILAALLEACVISKHDD